MDIKDYFSSFELPPAREKDEKKKKVPFFCPKCEEIRGVEGRGTVLSTHYEEMMWKAFEMCSACYVLTRDHPDQVEENKRQFEEKQQEKQRRVEEEVRSRRFRVFFLDNDKFPASDFVNSISTVKFKKFPSTHSRGLATASRELLKKEIAEETVNLLISKDLTAWFEEEAV